MPYYDVSIPLKLKTLTYQFEQDLDLEGFAVRVPLKNRFYNGLVIGKREEKPEGVTELKSIESVIGRVYSKKFMDFIRWISFHYASEIGVVLRATFFEEIVEILKGKRVKEREKKRNQKLEFYQELEALEIESQTIKRIENSIDEGKYKTILVHCPNGQYEFRLMLETAKYILSKNLKGILICPTIAEANWIFNKISDKRAILLHSELSRSENLNALNKIVSGEINVIVGTRIALFVDIERLSVIFVCQESNWLYKAEESPRYNLREAAIMRGFIEEIPVVLTDFMPSVSSYYNASKGKFEFIDNFNILRHPEIRILKQPNDRVFSPELLFRIKLKDEQKFLILSPRIGYSLLICSECNQILRCKRCSSSLIFHRDSKTLECKSCKSFEKIYDQCPYCGSFDLRSFGTGVERVLEELKNSTSKPIEYIEYISPENRQVEGIVVGQVGKLKKCFVPLFNAVVFLDFDYYLSIPDYRAMERAFSKVLSIAHLLEPDGKIFIQTRNPENPFYQYLRTYDFKKFYTMELKHREETGFPPYGRLVKLNLILGKSSHQDKLEKVQSILRNNISGTVTGPIKGKRNGEFLFILRSKDKRKIIEETHSSLEKINQIGGTSYKIEVDPVNLSEF